MSEFNLSLEPDDILAGLSKQVDSGNGFDSLLAPDDGPPDFESLFDPSGLPELPDIQSGDPESVAAQEVSDMMQMIREQRKNNAERFRDVESGEFWFCVCFQSRSQKEEFLQKLLEKFSPGDDVRHFGDKYVSGLALAVMLGIPVNKIDLVVKKNRQAPKSLRGEEVI